MRDRFRFTVTVRKRLVCPNIGINVYTFEYEDIDFPFGKSVGKTSKVALKEAEDYFSNATDYYEKTIVKWNGCNGYTVKSGKNEEAVNGVYEGYLS